MTLCTLLFLSWLCTPSSESVGAGEYRLEIMARDEILGFKSIQDCEAQRPFIQSELERDVKLKKAMTTVETRCEADHRRAR